MTTLSERAMLVTLKISQWTAKKLDRQETTALNRAHGLTVEAARVHKDLFPLATSLERVHQLTGAIRKEFAAMTLPWGIDGVNILKASAYVDFCGHVNRWQADWEEAVEQFLSEYPELYREAQLLLGTLFKPEDYPPASELRRRFGFGIRFMPVPDERDWRVDVGDAERSRLEEDIRRRLQETEAAAMQEAWRRVHEIVARAHERLSDPQNVFRDSLVDNAIELCGVLPALNIADDPALEKARQQLERTLAPYKANKDPLRNDPQQRSAAAKQLDAIMRKMSASYQPPAQALAA